MMPLAVARPSGPALKGGVSAPWIDTLSRDLRYRSGGALRRGIGADTYRVLWSRRSGFHPQPRLRSVMASS